MSVFNGAEQLEESIKSIINQTFRDFEFIICDDGSTDKSAQIIHNYIKIDHRIIYIKNEKNLGLSASLNKCISIASGEFIARMDADDISLEDRFEKQVDYLNKNPNLSFVGGNIYLINSNGIWGSRILTRYLTKENIFKYQPITHPTVMMRRVHLQEIGGYTVASYTKRGQDFDLWCKFYERGYSGENIGEIVLKYREDENTYTRRKFKFRVDSYKMKRIWRRRLELPLIYELFALKPIFTGIIPMSLIKAYHKYKYKK